MGASGSRWDTAMTEELEEDKCVEQARKLINILPMRHECPHLLATRCWLLAAPSHEALCFARLTQKDFNIGEDVGPMFVTADGAGASWREEEQYL